LATTNPEKYDHPANDKAMYASDRAKTCQHSLMHSNPVELPSAGRKNDNPNSAPATIAILTSGFNFVKPTIAVIRDYGKRGRRTRSLVRHGFGNAAY
jgi:hypothetical protein